MIPFYFKQLLSGKILSFWRKKSQLGVLLLVCLVTGSFAQTTPPTGSAPPAATYCVDAECYFLGKNTFTENGTTNTRPRYFNETDQRMEYLVTPTAPNGNGWYIYSPGNVSNTYYYYNSSTASLPPSSGWTSLGNGCSNTITVSSGSCATAPESAPFCISDYCIVNGIYRHYLDAFSSLNPSSPGYDYELYFNNRSIFLNFNLTNGSQTIIAYFNTNNVLVLGGSFTADNPGWYVLRQSGSTLAKQAYNPSTSISLPTTGWQADANLNCTTTGPTFGTPLTPSVNIVANPGTSISGGTTVTFTASPINGGGSPSYQWKKNSSNVGTNSNQYADNALQDGDVISVVMTSNSPCALPATATSNALTMTVGAPANVSVCVESECTNVGGEYVQDGEFNDRPSLYDDEGNNMWYFAGDGQSAPGWYIDGEDPINSSVSLYYNPSNSMTPPTEGWVATDDNSCDSDGIVVTIGACGACLTIFDITGGGTICPTGSAPIGLDGSEVGVSYQLYFDDAPQGDPVAGTGNPLSFGNFTAQGVYNVKASNANCSNVDMKGAEGVLGIDISHSSAVIPAVGIAANPTGSIASGTSVTFTATPTNGGTAPAYQWKKNNNNVGTNSNQYTDNTLVNGDVIKVVMTPSSEVCASPTTGTSTEITMTVGSSCTPPTALSVTGGGGYCEAQNILVAGLPVGLAGNSESGVSYQLYRNNVDPVGSPINGNGQPILFGNQTAGAYTVVATRSPGCSTTMNGSAIIEAIPVPTAFNVTGGGGICPGGTAVSINLSGSENGVSYQVKRNNTTVGNPVLGDGNALSFGPFNTPGTYTIAATRTYAQNTPQAPTQPLEECSIDMNGTAQIINLSVSAGTIAANQSICAGTAPANLSASGLVGSVVKWQRATNANFTGATDINVAASTLPGNTIGAISVDTWFRAVIQNGTCPPANSNAVRVSVLPSFTAEANSSASLICSNQTLRLTATPNQAGLTYNWRGPANFGSTLQSPTRTGLTTAMSGVYSVTITRSSCNSVSSATVSVVVSPSGTAFAPQMSQLRFNNTAPNAQTNTVDVCAGTAVALNITANQHTLTYNWRGPAGGSGSGFMSAPVNGVTTASASISAAVAANQQGQYTVTVRNGCSVANHRVINLQVRNCTSTRLASAEGESTFGLAINLAPNPVRDYLTASFEGVEGQTIQLQLIDAQGRSRQQVAIEAAEGKAQHRFDLRSLPAGMYLLQAETATQRAAKKVIKL